MKKIIFIMLTLMVSLSTMAKRYEIVSPSNTMKMYIEIEKGSLAMEMVPLKDEELQYYVYTKFYGESIIWENNKSVFQADRAYAKGFKDGKIHEEDVFWPFNGLVTITWLGPKKVRVVLDHVRNNEKETLTWTVK